MYPSNECRRPEGTDSCDETNRCVVIRNSQWVEDSMCFVVDLAAGRQYRDLGRTFPDKLHA